MRRYSTWSLGSIGIAIAGVLAACQSGEPGNENADGGAVRSYGSVGQRLEEAPVDTIESYSAKCDAATGIRVPAFSCTNLPMGPDQQVNSAFAVIDQSSSADNVEGSPIAIGNPLTPARTPRPEVSPTAFTMTSGGFGSVDENADQFYFATTRLVRSFSSPTMGTEFSRAYLVEVELEDLQAGTCTEQDCVPQAGVMIRADAGAADPFAMLSFQADGKLVLKRRQSTGAGTENVFESEQFSLPLRLRLQWDGTELIAEVAREGEDWQRFGPAPIALPDGITIASGNNLGGVAIAAATAHYKNFFTPRKCDRPNALNGTCQPESTFQVVERTADAVVVANCRKSATFSDDEFGDIAVIQYNRKNGAVCFYQSPGEALDGSFVQAPSLGSTYQGDAPEGPCASGEADDPFCWITPAETHEVGCTGCHDSTALIRSPYIMDSGLVPETGFKSREGAPPRFVGHAYNQDRSWLVKPPPNDPANACITCHDLAVNNVQTVDDQGGTAFRFATMATTPYQNQEPTRAVDPLFEPKNTVSETSPTWMPPGGAITSYPNLPGPDPATWIPELQWANVYRECAAQFWEAIGGGTNPPPYVDVPPSVPGGCEFIPYGTAFAPWLGVLNALETNIGGGGGSAEGNFDAFTLTSPMGSDVFGAADKAYTISAIMQGDGYLVVKVTGLENTDPYAKAGLMFRESTAVGAKNVMLALTAQHGMQLHYRSSTNGTTVQSPLVSSPSLQTQSFPVWLRLERAGNTVIGSISTDERNSWQRVAEPVTFSSFNPQVQAVVNTSHNNLEEGSATFQSLDFTPTQGWMGPNDPHLLVDLNYGNSTGKRREWITEERMSSQGSDIYGTQDSALFSFKSFAGNGELQTIVKAYDAKTRFGKAGLMVRASGASNAANVFFGRIRDGLTFQHRQNAGGSTVSYNCENLPNLPDRLMLRLVRSGSSFTAFYKGVDASTWQQMKNCSNNQNLALTLSGLTSSAPVLAGLAVSSESGAGPTTATFWSGKTVEPPGFLWSAIGTSPNTPEEDPNPEPEPEPEGRPCDNFCAAAQEFNYDGQNNYQSNSLTSSERCMETFTPTSGGNCGQMGSRVLRVNGVQMPCNSAPWPTLPAEVNGGYCVHVTAGTPSYAWFSVHE